MCPMLAICWQYARNPCEQIDLDSKACQHAGHSLWSMLLLLCMFSNLCVCWNVVEVRFPGPVQGWWFTNRTGFEVCIDWEKRVMEPKLLFNSEHTWTMLHIPFKNNANQQSLFLYSWVLSKVHPGPHVSISCWYIGIVKIVIILLHWCSHHRNGSVARTETMPSCEARILAALDANVPSWQAHPADGVPPIWTWLMFSCQARFN